MFVSNSQTKTQTIDMVNGPLLKNICIFSVPLMLTNLVQMMFNAADAVVMGRFAGQQALAAVGATSSLCFLLISLFNGLSVGSNVVIARYLGANDLGKVEKSVHTSIATAMLSGVFLMIVGFFASRPLLQMMSTPTDIIDLSVLYMRIYFVGTFFTLIYNFGAAIFRSVGDTKRPLYFLLISGVIKVVLSLLFVIVLQWGVAGVALSTAIGQAIAAAMVCLTLIKEKGPHHLDFKKLSIDVPMALDIIKIGVPAGIQGMVFALSNVVIQSSINSFNSSVIVAGNSAANNIENFVYIGMSAFTQACITFTSQNIGAHKLQRVGTIFKQSMILTILSAASIGFLAWFFGEFFLGLYTPDAAVVEAGMVRLLWVTMPLWLNGVLDVFVASMRGFGYSTGPTILTIVGICGVRLTWIWTVFQLHRSLDVIYMCFPLSWIITSIVLGLYWFKCYRKLMKTA